MKISSSFFFCRNPSVATFWVVIVSLLLFPERYHVTAFSSCGTPLGSSLSSSLKLSATSEETPSTKVTEKGLLKRERYVATNRFAVRKNQQAKFEKRWATRKSRLATLDGFQYFHLMRRVVAWNDNETRYDEGDSKDGTSSLGNYVSFTIWDKKSSFSAWRNGEAFKEAHGGTSIAAFLSTMINSAFVLQGAPKPAFYDGLLVQSTQPSTIPPTTPEGWRTGILADGIHTLPTECFVACNQFFVPPENAVAFEQRWANRESKLRDCDGFIAFLMLRRDASAKGHGVVPLTSGEPSYVTTTIWRDREAFQQWRRGNNFQQAHATAAANNNSNSDTENKAPPQPLWDKPPVPVFYEGTLVISSSEGV